MTFSCSKVLQLLKHLLESGILCLMSHVYAVFNIHGRTLLAACQSAPDKHGTHYEFKMSFSRFH